MVAAGGPLQASTWSSSFTWPPFGISSSSSSMLL
jgi:hypothetical protein